MAIIERPSANGKAYQVVFYIGGEFGRIKETFKTRAEAKAREAELLLQKRKNELARPNQQPFGEFLEDWLKRLPASGLNGRTIEGYADLLRLHVLPALGKERLDKLSTEKIQAVYDAMSSRTKPLSPRTVRITNNAVRKALADAQRRKLIPKNYALDVELPRERRREMVTLTPEQARALRREMEQCEHGVLFLFAVVTGMRPSEYLALKWSDFLWDLNQVMVRRILSRTKKSWQFTEPKTDKSRRIVQFPGWMMEHLRAHQEAQLVNRAKAGDRWADHDLVFPTRTGSPMDRKNLLQRHFRPLLGKLGLPLTVRLYDLRHTMATLLLVGGEHPKVVADMLGHSSTRLTLDVYSHVLPPLQAAAVEKLSAILLAD